MDILTVLTTTDSPVESSDFISKIIPNWVSFTVQILALIVMIIVVIIFAYKPVKKLIQKRQDYIEQNIKDAEKAKANALVSETNAREMVIASTKEANQILESAKLEAKEERNRQIEETNLEISKMKSNAEEDISRAKEDAKEQMRQEMIDVAMLTSEQILKHNVSDEDNQKLADDFIKDIEK